MQKKSILVVLILLSSIFFIHPIENIDSMVTRQTKNDKSKINSTSIQESIDKIYSDISFNNGYPEEQWNKTYGGSSYDEGYALKQTNDGGYIITGATISYGAGNWDIWLIKTDANGNEQWNITFGGSGYDRGNSIQQTIDSSYIIGGYTTSYGNGNFDYWLIKTDANGNELWNTTYGGTNSDQGYSVDQTIDGGYIIAGYTESFGAGHSDFWLIKTDANGNELWNTTYGGTEHDKCFSGQQTNDGGYILIGYTVSFDLDYSGCDIWLIKTDANGNEQWNKTFGGNEITNKFDIAYEVQQTPDGGYIIAAETEVLYISSMDVLLIKTDSQGNEEWNKTFGGADFDSSRSVQQTIDGGYIVTGNTESFGESDPDLWVFKTDYMGDEIWNNTFGLENGSGDWGYAIEITNNGNYIVVGATMSNPWNRKTSLSLNNRQEGTDVWLINILGDADTGPVADFSWEPVFPIIEYPIEFIDLSTDNTYDIVNWSWTFGDGNTSFEQNPIHQYTFLGNYTVCLNVTNSINATDDVCQLIMVIDGIIIYLDFCIGWNLMTVPMENTMWASDLSENITGCTSVSKWDNVNQTYYTYIVGGPDSFDFQLQDGLGYFVDVIQPTNCSFTGTPIDLVNVSLQMGWNLIGWYHQDNTTAMSLSENISGCLSVSKWDNVNQTYYTYIVGGPDSFDFTITCGMGLFVDVTEESVWYGEG
jgi:PKD repeat protein